MQEGKATMTNRPRYFFGDFSCLRENKSCNILFYMFQFVYLSFVTASVQKRQNKKQIFQCHPHEGIMG